jgi:hypothetical protein
MRGRRRPAGRRSPIGDLQARPIWRMAPADRLRDPGSMRAAPRRRAHAVGQPLRPAVRSARHRRTRRSPIGAEDHISDGCDVALVPWKFRTLVPAGRDLGPGGQGADGRDQGARRPAAARRSRADGSGSFRICRPTLSGDIASRRITGGQRDISVRVGRLTSAVIWSRCHLVSHWPLERAFRIV